MEQRSYGHGHGHGHNTSHTPPLSSSQTTTTTTPDSQSGTKVLVVGAGFMGILIITELARRGAQVTVFEINDRVRASTIRRAEQVLLSYAKQDRMLSHTSIYRILGRIKVSPCAALREITSARPSFSLVVEAVVEDLKIKQSVFASLGGLIQANRDIVLATTSINIPIDEITANMKQFDSLRVLGLRFLHPVLFIPFVVVSEGEGTSEDTVRCLHSDLLALGLQTQTAFSKDWYPKDILNQTQVDELHNAWKAKSGVPPLCRWAERCRDVNDREHCTMFLHPHLYKKWEIEGESQVTRRRPRTQEETPSLPRCRYGGLCRSFTDEEHCKAYAHPGPCRFGDRCAKRKDEQHAKEFYHPAGAAAPEKRAAPRGRPCRWGASCKRTNDEEHMKAFSHDSTQGHNATPAAMEIDAEIVDDGKDVGEKEAEEQEKEKEEKAEEEEDDTCVICFDNPKDALMYPCGHVAVCNDCGKTLMQSTAICPICRAQILSVVRMYKV